MEHESSTGSAPARRPEPVGSWLDRMQSLVAEIIRKAGFDLQFKIRHNVADDLRAEEPEWVLEFTGPDSELVLEGRAELLDALEYVVLRSVRSDDEQLFTKISFDCDGWRRLRMEELRLTARAAAEKVLEGGDPLPLGAMNPRERRVVHLALRDMAGVRTESQGYGQRREVVIFPASPATRR